MTRFEQIAAAFPLHAQRIAELAHASGNSVWLQCDSCNWDGADVLAGAFSWTRMVEGFEYWRDLALGAL